MFGVITVRVLDLSYFNREKYYKALEKTRKSSIILPAKRGSILDRNLETLAVDEASIIIGVDPYFANVEKDKTKISALAEILELDENFVIDKFTKRRKIINNKSGKIRWVPICEINSDALYSSVKLIDVKGVYGIKTHKRLYPLEQKICHISGFVNKEGIPVCGIEKFMDFFLRGQDGYIESEKDGKSQELVQYRKYEISPRNGNDVVLTIDQHIQQFVHDEIQSLVETFSPQWASVIVSEVGTGEILALVNYPDYDPNNYGKHPIENMKNLAIANIYEPGSVFKIVATSFGLEYDLVDEETIFDCSQTTAINNDRGLQVSLPKDHSPFDKLTFVDAVRKSSNRAAAQIALMIGEKEFYKCVTEFGFGSKSGYGFDGESAGIVPLLSKWDAITITRMPMGHSIGSSPIQTHCAMSVIANDGFLLKPNIIKCVKDGETVIFSNASVVKNRVISQNTAIRMRKVMSEPKKNKLVNGMVFGGKSGTGQKIINGKYSHDRHTSSYSGFFPANIPKILITVVVDDAKVSRGIAWGSTVSLPTFKRIANKIIQYLDL